MVYPYHGMMLSNTVQQAIDMCNHFINLKGIILSEKSHTQKGYILQYFIHIPFVNMK